MRDPMREKILLLSFRAVSLMSTTRRGAQCAHADKIDNEWMNECAYLLLLPPTGKKRLVPCLIIILVIALRPTISECSLIALIPLNVICSCRILPFYKRANLSTWSTYGYCLTNLVRAKTILLTHGEPGVTPTFLELETKFSGSQEPKAKNLAMVELGTSTVHQQLLLLGR